MTALANETEQPYYVFDEESVRQMFAVWSVYQLAKQDGTAEERQRAAETVAAWVQAARKLGWTLPQIATVFDADVTPEAIRQIPERYIPEIEAVNDAVEQLKPPKLVRPPKPEKPGLTHEEVQQLRDLAGYVRTHPVNRNTPLDSPDRTASEQFSAVLIAARDRGVPWSEITEHTPGYTRFGLVGRVRRHSPNPAPSFQDLAYTGQSSRERVEAFSEAAHQFFTTQSPVDEVRFVRELRALRTKKPVIAWAAIVEAANSGIPEKPWNTRALRQYL